MPIRNENWILQYNLPNILSWADHVLIADQHSTDGTRELYKKYPEVEVIDNNHKGHSNEVYWQLLEASRRFGNENIIFYIDADEWVPAEMMKAELDTLEYVPGTMIEMSWPNPWGGFKQCRVDGVFNDIHKRIGWIDNGQYKHNSGYVINGHTALTPDCEGEVIRLKTPLIHLQFTSWERLQWKQVWYRCVEHIAGASSPSLINNRYKHTLDPHPTSLMDMPREWSESLSVIPSEIALTPADWQKEAVLNFINERGVEFFEPLQIWHLPELHKKFIETTGREPKPETFPSWLLKINDERNRIKYKLRYWLGK